MTITIYRITIHRAQSLATAINTAGFDWVNRLIVALFSTPVGPERVAVVVIHYNRIMTTVQVLHDMLQRDLRPGNTAELVALSSNYRKLRRFPLVALDDTWIHRRGWEFCVCSDRGRVGMRLFLRRTDAPPGWCAESRFIAIRDR